MNEIKLTEVQTTRFWAKVNKGAPDECWEWTGACMGKRYGKLNLNGEMVGAHRISYVIANGPIPKGLYICHTCDNKKCVNPTHLYAGTHLDNMRDRDARIKTNHRLGSEHPHSKLDESDVINIVILKESGMKQSRIADIAGISQPTVCSLLSGKTWNHLTKIKCQN